MWERYALGITVTVSALLAGPPVFADEPAPVPEVNLNGGGGIGGYFSNWFARNAAARANQPSWMTPLATVTPELEQEVRYDQYWEQLGNGATIRQYDSGKGLEFIPTTTNEVLINAAPYLDRSDNKPASGWGDWGFLTIKQRLLSANEKHGDYVVSVFLGVEAPTGSPAFTKKSWLITPTLAAGKGWGNFDIQSTVGLANPTRNQDVLGYALTWNTTFQYHFAKFWPELEVNFTHWFGGLRGGKTQIFLTPGLILGRFNLINRLHFVIGAGYQVAVTPKLTRSPVLTPTYNHAWIVSVRTPF